MLGWHRNLRRWVALVAAAACLVLIAPPAAADDCCARDCNEVCCLLLERAGLGHHHHHHGDAGGPGWSALSAPDSHCAAACPPGSAGRGVGAAPAGGWSAAPAVAGVLAGRPASLPDRAHPRRTADPRGPPSSPSIAV